MILNTKGDIDKPIGFEFESYQSEGV